MGEQERGLLILIFCWHLGSMKMSMDGNWFFVVGFSRIHPQRSALCACTKTRYDNLIDWLFQKSDLKLKASTTLAPLTSSTI